MAGSFSLKGITTPPAGVLLNPSWAPSVWNLYRNDITGPQGISAFKVPRVDSFPAGVSLPAAPSKIITISGACSLDGWDLGGFTILLNASNVSITNCLLDPYGGSFRYILVGQAGGPYSGIVIRNNTFNGKMAANSDLAVAIISQITIGSSSAPEVSFNKFLWAQEHCIDVIQGTTGALIHDNYFTVPGFGSSTVHADCIDIEGGSGHRFYRNMLDVTRVFGVFGATNAIRVNPFTSPLAVDDCEIYNNIEKGATAWTVYPFQSVGQSGGVCSNISVHDNLWEVGSTGAWFHPSEDGVTVSANNNQLSNGAALPEII